MDKAYFNWSSGKDSVWALHGILNQGHYDVAKLVTTVNTDFDRVSMHGLRTSLLYEQAKAIGIPLEVIDLKENVSMSSYNAKMKETMESLKSEGFIHSIFGDIFLEDLKAYRENKLSEVGINAVFPLWKQDTKSLLHEFLDAGYKAITVCTNAKLLDPSFCGRMLDSRFIDDLPDNVDVCGENGEFHTFVYDGPIFREPIQFTVGEKVLRNYTPSNDGDDCYSGDAAWETSFWYCDLLPTTL